MVCKVFVALRPPATMEWELFKVASIKRNRKKRFLESWKLSRNARQLIILQNGLNKNDEGLKLLSEASLEIVRSHYGEKRSELTKIAEKKPAKKRSGKATQTDKSDAQVDLEDAMEAGDEHRHM